MPRLCVRVLAVLCVLFVAQLVSAKVYWLPDYLDENLDRNDNRVNPSNGGSGGSGGNGGHGITCATYGLLSASEIYGMECEKENIARVGICYKNCVCKEDEFPYTSDNCSGDRVPSGDSCQGSHFKECLCNTKNYPYTSSNCGSGYVLGGDSCSDSDGSHYETCASVCSKYDDLPNVSDCPYGCEIVVSDCTSKCRQCYADNCLNRPDNNTDYGCEKYWDDCPSKCQTGTICTPIDCSAYTLSSCPTNALCETCSPGCEDNSVKYKETCTPRDCSGYTLNSCPDGAICDECTPGCANNTTKYKKTGDACTPKDCSGYTLNSCPTNALCDSCSPGCGDNTTKYKQTCTPKNCSGYTLSSCPAGAVCDECTPGCANNTTKYKKTGDACTPKDCSGYSLSSCPDRNSFE